MKISKLIIVAACILALNVGLTTQSTTAKAFSVNDCDAAFENSIQRILADQEIGSQELEIEKELVYDMSLNELGIVYEYNVNGEASYSILIEQDSEYIVTESFIGVQSPFNSCVGLYVYPAIGEYLYYFENEYFFTDGEKLSAQTINELKNISYCGTITFAQNIETINYSYKTQNDKRLTTRFPAYLGLPELQNSCAAIAGGNIIGYYDRYFVNLIPNYTPGVSVGKNYLYKAQSTEVKNMITTLHNDMGAGPTGTTVSNFKIGMTKYVNGCGYNLSYTSCMSSAGLNYQTVKSSVDGNKPIALFCSRYNVSKIEEDMDKKTDIINYNSSYSNHVLVGYGYLDINYTYSNSAIKNYRYIEVSSGVSTFSTGYYNIDCYSILNDAYSINIF